MPEQLPRHRQHDAPCLLGVHGSALACSHTQYPTFSQFPNDDFISQFPISFLLALCNSINVGSIKTFLRVILFFCASFDAADLLGFYFLQFSPATGLSRPDSHHVGKWSAELCGPWVLELCLGFPSHFRKYAHCIDVSLLSHTSEHHMF